MSSIVGFLKSFESRRYLNSDRENPIKRKRMRYKNRVNFYEFLTRLEVVRK